MNMFVCMVKTCCVPLLLAGLTSQPCMGSSITLLSLKTARGLYHPSVDDKQHKPWEFFLPPVLCKFGFGGL